MNVVGSCLLFAARATEGVDGGPDTDLGETRFVHDLLPALTGQPSRDSASPEINVAERLGRDRSTVGDVGELQPPARLEYTSDLVEDGTLVGT